MWVKHLFIPDKQIVMTAVRSQGAGGQNVNKVATAIHLKFDIVGASLPPQIKQRLLNCQDNRITQHGVLIIKSQESRSQLINKEIAQMRLKDFIAQALNVKKIRKKSKPTKAAKQKRLNEKSKRGKLKQLRSKQHDNA